MVEQLFKIGASADFAQGLIRRQVGKRPLVVVHVDGRLQAYHASCPHADEILRCPSRLCPAMSFSRNFAC